MILAVVILAALGASQESSIVNRRVGAHLTVGQALAAAEFDFRKARPVDQLRLTFRHGQLELLEYRKSVLTAWQVRRVGERYVARKREVEREQRVDVVELTVDSSVWDAARAAGERPEVAVAMADVFAWDIDFYRDVQRGDVMRAVVEKVLHKGRVLEYGRVLAAEYDGQAVGHKETYRFTLPDGTESYFGPDGSAARRTFLKSPLKLALVTSRFGGRFHPVLNTFRNHNGIDYHAPVGTPVWAVADGVVSRAGYDAGGGNTVCLRHVKGFETCYLHLSRIAVRAGQHVMQKSIIAYSGNTGRLTTGPHLHYGMKRNGAWVNPLNQRFPRGEPLPAQLKDVFLSSIAGVQARLQASRVATAPY